MILYSIMVNKQGVLSIVRKGSKKYRRIKSTCREYKTHSNKNLLQKEVEMTNLLLLN